MVYLGVIHISENSREKLSLVFTYLSFLLSFLSLILVLNSVYLTFIISPNLHSEKAIIRLIFTIMGMLAMQLTAYYIAGIFVYKKCHVESYKKNSRYLLRIWIFSGYSSILNILIIGAMSAGVSNHIVRSMHHSMVRGMKRYLKDNTWKNVIDNLQYKFHCCGSKWYTDWYEIPWLTTYHIINTSAHVLHRCKLNGDRVYFPGVPWSCCRMDYDKQCFHDPLQQYLYSKDWDKLIADSVYNIGCIETLREPVENSFLIFILFSYILTFLQVILTIISRYLYTSHRNAIILGDPFGTSPGWLIGSDPYLITNSRSSSVTNSGMSLRCPCALKKKACTCTGTYVSYGESLRSIKR